MPRWMDSYTPALLRDMFAIPVATTGDDNICLAQDEHTENGDDPAATPGDV